MTNEIVRNELKKQKVYLWEVADRLNVSEMTITRMMRHEFPDEKQKELVSLIKEIGKKKGGE